MSKRSNKRRFIQKLRKEATPAEIHFRNILREHKMSGNIKDQYPLGPYIADFCHVKGRLVIEIDGSSHRGREEYDAIRTDRLYDYGYREIRFTNEQVFGDPKPLIAAIQEAIALPKLKETRSAHYVAPTWQRIQSYAQSKSKEIQRKCGNVKMPKRTAKNALIANPSVIGKVVYVPPPKP